MGAYRAEDVAAVYLATFAGRTDAYSEHTGAQWIAVREPLTPAVVVDHIAARRPLAFYFLAPDTRTHVAAVDFDTPDGWAQALALGRVLWADAAPCYVEHSGRGAHLWAVCEERLPAILWRHALRAWLQAADLPADDPRIELRPGADTLAGPESLGHALRAPMMPHPATGEAWPLCDPRDEHVLSPKVAGMLLVHEPAAPAPIIAAAERYRPPVTEVTAPRREPVPSGASPIARFNAEVGVCAVLEREWHVPNARPGRTVRCPAHEDRHASLSIARDDSRAWCHAPSCELYGRDGQGADAFALWALAQGRSAAA
jgi:hypothetical protein